MRTNACVYVMDMEIEFLATSEENVKYPQPPRQIPGYTSGLVTQRMNMR